jgi:hypothetical protein
MNDMEGEFQDVLAELTFHGVALFSREHIEPRVDYPFYTMAIIEHICHEKCGHLLIEMGSTFTEVASKFTR